MLQEALGYSLFEIERKIGRSLSEKESNWITNKVYDGYLQPVKEWINNQANQHLTMLNQQKEQLKKTLLNLENELEFHKETGKFY